MLTENRMKSSVLWDITLRSCSMKVNRRFGRTRCLHVKRREVNQARNQYEAGLQPDCVANSSNLKMDTICKCETLVTQSCPADIGGSLSGWKVAGARSSL
jgi:hypothetical protein